LREKHGDTAPWLQLHDAFADEFVFSGEQILHKSVAAFVDIARRSGEMMIDSRPR
jgi:hypothetical protein